MTLLLLSFVYGIGVASACLTITRRNPIHSALFLILTLLTVATGFLFLRADFLAMIQVIVYAGAIMVLIIFVLLLTAQEKLQKERLLHRQSPLALLIGLGLWIELCTFLFQKTSPLLPSPSPEKIDDSVRGLGAALFTKYVFPFELASLLLLVALVATVTIAKKEDGVEEKRQAGP